MKLVLVAILALIVYTQAPPVPNDAPAGTDFQETPVEDEPKEEDTLDEKDDDDYKETKDELQKESFNDQADQADLPLGEELFEPQQYEDVNSDTPFGTVIEDTPFEYETNEEDALFEKDEDYYKKTKAEVQFEPFNDQEVLPLEGEKQEVNKDAPGGTVIEDTPFEDETKEEATLFEKDEDDYKEIKAEDQEEPLNDQEVLSPEDELIEQKQEVNEDVPDGAAFEDTPFEDESKEETKLLEKDKDDYKEIKDELQQERFNDKEFLPIEDELSEPKQDEELNEDVSDDNNGLATKNAAETKDVPFQEKYEVEDEPMEYDYSDDKDTKEEDEYGPMRYENEMDDISDDNDGLDEINAAETKNVPFQDENEVEYEPKEYDYSDDKDAKDEEKYGPTRYEDEKDGTVGGSDVISDLMSFNDAVWKNDQPDSVQAAAEVIMPIEKDGDATFADNRKEENAYVNKAPEDKSTFYENDDYDVPQDEFLQKYEPQEYAFQDEYPQQYGAVQDEEGGTQLDVPAVPAEDDRIYDETDYYPEIKDFPVYQDDPNYEDGKPEAEYQPKRKDEIEN